MHLSHIPKCTIQYKSVHFFLSCVFFLQNYWVPIPLVLHIYMSQWTRSALIEIMAYRLFVPSHYLNQYWFIFIGLLWANVSVILFIKQHSSFMKISKCIWNCRLQNDGHFIQRHEIKYSHTETPLFHNEKCVILTCKQWRTNRPRSYTNACHHCPAGRYRNYHPGALFFFNSLQLI